MKTSCFFAWYDFWVGLFWDKKKRILYFCPLPCIVIKFELEEKNKWDWTLLTIVGTVLTLLFIVGGRLLRTRPAYRRST